MLLLTQIIPTVPEGRAMTLSTWTVLLVILSTAYGTFAVSLHKSEEPQVDAVVTLVDDILQVRLPDVVILTKGAQHQDFERPLPKTVDPTVLQRFENFFNRTQDFNARGPNTFAASGADYVALVPNGFVTGVLGSVFDQKARIYTEFTHTTAGLPLDQFDKLDQLPCKRFKRLATVIQKYGHMYYHFVDEVLPRVLLLQPHLTPETKLLTFGGAHELRWLAQLGIPASQVEVYDPSSTYCAEELLLPSPVSVITPPREAYLQVRNAFGADPPLPTDQLDTIVYCSRAGASDRQVSNEPALLAALRAAYPQYRLVTLTGAESVADTVALFRRARAVVGMHGAGLSHVLFSAPGTAVLEFLFMYDPPMMFWHASGALGLDYVMLPLPQSWWLAKEVEVPVEDMVESLALALGPPAGAEEAGRGCVAGSQWDEGSRRCQACPPGTYRTSASGRRCLACAGGRVSLVQGAAFCQICPVSTFSSDPTQPCAACPEGTSTLFAGSTSSVSCLDPSQIQTQVDSMFLEGYLVDKLVQIPLMQEKARELRSALGKASWWGRRKLLQQQESLVHLREGMLNDLFNSDSILAQPLAVAAAEMEDGSSTVSGNGNGRDLQGVWEEEQGVDSGSEEGELMDLSGSGSRDLLQYMAGRRHLLQYSTGSGRRRLLQYANGRRALLQYSNGRHLLQYANGRRMLLQYSAGRNLLQYSSGSRHLLQYSSGGRRLLQYTNGRRLLQYSAGRHLLQYASDGGRRLLQYSSGRRLLQYVNSGRRMLLQYSNGRRLLQYSSGRRLLQYINAGGRHLLQYATAPGRHLLQYSRSLAETHADAPSAGGMSQVLSNLRDVFGSWARGLMPTRHA